MYHGRGIVLFYDRGTGNLCSNAEQVAIVDGAVHEVIRFTEEDRTAAKLCRLQGVHRGVSFQQRRLYNVAESRKAQIYGFHWLAGNAVAVNTIVLRVKVMQEIGNGKAGRFAIGTRQRELIALPDVAQVNLMHEGHVGRSYARGGEGFCALFTKVCKHIRYYAWLKTVDLLD